MRLTIAAATVIGACALCATLTPARFSSRSAKSADVPRLVVLLTIDALRADHLGIYGYPRPTSPNIDAFGREAIVIEDAIAQAPFTKASIASLMTGLYPDAHKASTTAFTVADAMDGSVEGTPPTTDVLPAAVTTMAEAFKAAGYRTSAIATNPFLIADFGFAQGFDQFEFMGGEDFAPADRVLSRALQIIDSRPSPLFLWVHLMEPHSPYAPPDVFRRALPPLSPPRMIPRDTIIPPWIAIEGMRDLRVYESLYDGEIRAVDAAFATFVAGVRSRRSWSETVLVVTADHGEQFLEHGEFEHNSNLHDELIRVPLIIHGPGLTPRYIQAQAQLIDVMPTLVNLAGGRLPDGIHGRDLRPVLRGERLQSEPAFAQVGEQYAVRTREWKLIAGPGRARQLYALRRDPGEQHSLEHPKRVAELEEVLKRVITSAARAGANVTRGAAPISPTMRRRLEALGYMQR